MLRYNSIIVNLPGRDQFLLVMSMDIICGVFGTKLFFIDETKNKKAMA